MIKAVIFDMFETLASLFEGQTYFSEDIAFDLGLPHDAFRSAWHLTEEDRTIGKCTIREAAALTLKRLGAYSDESVSLIERKRRENLSDTFGADLSESVAMLKKLKEHGLKTGLISNCYSDERDMIKKSVLYPYIDVPVLSFECGTSANRMRGFFCFAPRRLAFCPPSVCMSETAAPESCLLQKRAA